MNAPSPEPVALPTIADVEAAAARIKGVAIRTPLLNFPVLDEHLGARVYLKAETLQRTGSFKFRGAYNKISSIPADRKKGGVVAYSSGNHAQGVAHAAALCGVPAVIVMPSDAPKAKRERTKAFGAEVVLYDRDREDRAAIARRIADERGAVLVPPFDDPLIIAGQGTAGREICEDLAALGVKPDVAVIGASGGGLMAGISLALKARVPDTRTNWNGNLTPAGTCRAAGSCRPSAASLDSMVDMDVPKRSQTRLRRTTIVPSSRSPCT